MQLAERVHRVKIVRAPRDGRFAIIPNAALEDARLSFRARGVLAYLLSRPDGWATSADRLATGAREGRRAILTALTELEAVGYLHRVKAQDDRGRWSTVAHLTDSPQPVDSGATGVRLPNAGEPDAGPQSLSSKTDTKTPPPPWCGVCDADTRHLEDILDGAPLSRRCPTCHPLERH